MAYVYKAFCRKTNNTVAVKILKEKFADSAEYVKRFKKEAEAVFSLEHENIVRVSDIGCEDGTYYMVMEYIPGSTLKSLIQKNGAIPEREAILFAIQICSALSAAHKRGIIHRDIKPHNILLDNDHTAKVTDFGIAKSISTSQDEEKEVIGSVYYVSPEQARGDSVDARTDIYSLGIMLYQMVTGELPYTGDQTVSVALKHINEKITAPIEKNPVLSKSINNIVLKATRKNKKDRYRSMEAFKEDLVRALLDPTGDFVDLPDAYQSNDQPTVSKHKWWKLGVLIVIAAILITAAVFVVFLIKDSHSQRLIMPNLSGQTVDSATQTLNSMGLKAQIVFESSETIEEGIVISQTPDPDNTINTGNTVTLTISNGPETLHMPDVTNIALQEATDIIVNMGLILDNVTYEFHSDIPAGIVLSQIPSENSEVLAGNTVNLVVATDIEQEDMPMPQVIDSSIENAVSSLYESGFNNVYVFTTESDKLEGTVYEQSPAPGIPTSYNDEIDLIISQYQERGYYAQFSEQIDVPDKESKIRIVIVSEQNNVEINYVVYNEPAPYSGLIPIKKELDFISGGTKTVKVFVNNVETISREVEFVKRDEE
jgi:serine/threonine-protein kinase